jgi:hypothetical protein
MYRLLLCFIVCGFFISCSKNENNTPPAGVIPDVINGSVTEIILTPINITTPDKGTFFIFSNNTRYTVEFNAVSNAQSNAILIFDSDTILSDDSREYTNLGNDAVSYNPLRNNNITLILNDGKKVNGFFDIKTSFGGVFGEAVISQWRTPGDPTKPTQKAKDDIINLVYRYGDKDGPGPEIAPQYLFAKISKG